MRPNEHLADRIRRARFAHCQNKAAIRFGLRDWMRLQRCFRRCDQPRLQSAICPSLCTPLPRPRRRPQEGTPGAALSGPRMREPDRRRLATTCADLVNGKQMFRAREGWCHSVEVSSAKIGACPTPTDAGSCSALGAHQGRSDDSANRGCNRGVRPRTFRHRDHAAGAAEDMTNRPGSLFAGGP